MLAVRTTILHYPRFDAELSRALRAAAAQLAISVFYLGEEPCQGHRYVIEERMRHACDVEEADWLISVGGTWPAAGPSPEEIVPAATDSVLERRLPGIAESMRSHARPSCPQAMLDGSLAGIRGLTFVLNLPADSELISHYIVALDPIVEALFLALRTERNVPVAESRTRADSQPAAAPVLRADEFRQFLAQRKTSA